MENIWEQVEDLRNSYPILASDRCPIDIFTFFEVDLGLDAIPFTGLNNKYRLDAAITADFTGIYLDEEQYCLMDSAPEWKLNRLRFTVAHELAHFFLHRDLPQTKDFISLENYSHWSRTLGGSKYSIEQEANEFAGRLLVPYPRLQDLFDEFAARARKLVEDFSSNETLRNQFAKQVAPKFGVHTQAIETRLDREGIWPIA